MDRFQNEATVLINLDELPARRIPEEIGQLTSVNDLTIQPSQPTGNWTDYPPLSWYETRELKEPFLKLPASIGQLTPLKSLRLSNLDIHELPESISQLKNLEFLGPVDEQARIIKRITQAQTSENIREPLSRGRNEGISATES